MVPSVFFPLAAVAVLFYALRAFELISMSSTPLFVMVFLAGNLGLLSMVFSPPKGVMAVLKRILLVVLVMFQLKTEMDSKLDAFAVWPSFSSRVSVVTDADSEVGLAVSTMLFQSGSLVVMACKSQDSCSNAASHVNNAPLLKQFRNHTAGSLATLALDFSDLHSVKSFVKTFRESYSRIDVLVINSDSVAPPGATTTQGWEAALGMSHLGSFALLKGLLPSLLTRAFSPGGDRDSSASRLIFVSSQAYLLGSFHSSMFTGDGSGDFKGEVTSGCGYTGPMQLAPCCPYLKCPGTNAFARAKLANVLTAIELQRRVDTEALAARNAVSVDQLVSRRLVASTVDPGMLGTSAQQFLRSRAPVNVFCRSGAQAALVIWNAITSDDFAPGSFIDSMLGSHDLTDGQSSALHSAAFPETQEFKFSLPTLQSFSFDNWVSDYANLCWNCESPQRNKTDVSKRLWEVSENLISSELKLSSSEW